MSLDLRIAPDPNPPKTAVPPAAGFDRLVPFFPGLADRSQEERIRFGMLPDVLQDGAQGLFLDVLQELPTCDHVELQRLPIEELEGLASIGRE